MFELLFFAQALAFLERLVLAMPLFIRRIRRVDPFLVDPVAGVLENYRERKKLEHVRHLDLEVEIVPQLPRARIAACIRGSG